MEPKTSDSYQREVLEKYRKEKGGEMRMYLAEPTRSQIRDACLYLFSRRKEKGDEHILNRFFQFKSDGNKLREIQNFGDGKFKSIENFLKGETKNTSTKNINLISWLIDFKPRPYEVYLRTDNFLSQKQEQNGIESEEAIPVENLDEESVQNSTKGSNGNEEGDKGITKWIKISISIVFGMTLMVFGVQKWYENRAVSHDREDGCMTWADSLYVSVSCNTRPFSKYGTDVKPLNQVELKNMRKVKVNAAYPFFSEDGKPLIWYYKNEDNGHEFFTAPGLHPVTGETLRKITPYIIETYVPIHSKKENSFIKQ